MTLAGSRAPPSRARKEGSLTALLLGGGVGAGGRVAAAVAIGAAVAVNSGGRRQARQVGAHDGAYLSEGHYRLYYGLGSDKGPVELEIRWPDGTRQSVPGVAIDRKVKIQQPG